MSAVKKTEGGPVVLGYWNYRGLVQSIRLLLKYIGTDFEDVRYKQDNDWYSVRDTLGLDFPNLPYFIDGDVKLTQSNAILAYIGRKNNLAGETEAEIATMDMLANVAMDFRNGWIKLIYNKNYSESMKDDYFKNLVSTLTRLSNYLGDKPWFTGSKVMYVDFMFYEHLDQHRMFDPQVLNKFPKLKEFLDRIEALPAIKEYMMSPDFQSWPVMDPPPRAAWGGGEKPNSA